MGRELQGSSNSLRETNATGYNQDDTMEDEADHMLAGTEYLSYAHLRSLLFKPFYFMPCLIKQRANKAFDQSSKDLN